MLNNLQDIVVTGLGCISALGNSLPANWDNLKNGRSGIRPAVNLDIGTLTAKHIAEVIYNPDDYFSTRQAASLDRVTQFALIAAKEAIEDAQLDPSRVPERIAVVLGTGVGGMETNYDANKRFLAQHKRVPPGTIPKGMPHAPSGNISIKYGVTGPAFMVTSACASSNHAISVAAGLIRAGVIDAAITGGTDAFISPVFYNAWEALRILDPDTCRPFSKDRNGLVLGEGAGVLILESAEHAASRGAESYGHYCGAGMSSDAHDIIKMSKQGAVNAMAQALESVNITPDKVDYISAHGTGTLLNDKTETAAIKDVFGDHAYELAISATKAMHGHALGASGGIEAVATLMAIKQGFIPPTINYNEPDPECDLDYTTNIGKQKTIRYALSNSFAFGGTNCVLVFSS